MRRLATVLLLGTLALACATDAGAGTETVIAHERSLETGAPLPRADDDRDVVVTITTPTDAVAMDLAGIETLGTVRTTILEPWLEVDITFEGIWLADLVDALDPGPDVEAMRLHALDDYEVVLDLDDIARGDALLATRMEGDAIPVADGGPLRLLFLDDEVGANTDLWIWNIDALSLG